jgi:hypothetical protein
LAKGVIGRVYNLLPESTGISLRSIACIYRVAKVVHGIVDLVPVILAEDETTINSRVAWNPKRDVFDKIFVGENQSMFASLILRW